MSKSFQQCIGRNDLCAVKASRTILEENLDIFHLSGSLVAAKKLYTRNN